MEGRWGHPSRKVIFVGDYIDIRHIDVKKTSDYRNPKVKALIKEAIDFAIKDMDKPSK